MNESSWKVKKMLESERALENKLNAERLKFFLPRLASLRIEAEIGQDKDGRITAEYKRLAVAKCPGCGRIVESNWEGLIPMIDMLMKEEGL